MSFLRGVLAAPWLAALALLGSSPDPAGAAFIHEYPRPQGIVQFHPRSDQLFTLNQLERALRLGAQAVELDLRWRAADSTVVCSHERRPLQSRPTLDDALTLLFKYQGRSSTMRRDGRQFYVVLDLKDESPPFHRALIQTLHAHAARLSNSARRTGAPRGLTVVITGFRAALEHSVPAAALDALCLIEGRTYGARIRDLSGRPGRFQWIALDYPVDRSRIEDLHAGRDPRAIGRFNVRVVGARGHVVQALGAGADAVNADLDEIEAAARWGAGSRRPRDPPP